MFKIKLQNQPRHPLTCDFYFFLHSHLTCPGIEECGRTGRGGEEEGGVLLLAHSCSRVVVEAD